MGRERGGGGRVGVRGRGTARSNGGRRAAAGPAAVCFFLSLFSPCTRSFARHAFLVARAHGARLGNWQQSRAIVARGGQAGVHARAKGTETADAPPLFFVVVACSVSHHTTHRADGPRRAPCMDRMRGRGSEGSPTVACALPFVACVRAGPFVRPTQKKECSRWPFARPPRPPTSSFFSIFRFVSPILCTAP